VVIVNCHNTNVTHWGLPVISPSGVWYCTVTRWVCSNIWKEHTKPRTQLHRITYQHTKILNPLPFWALYRYICHTHFQVLTYQVPGKKHDQDRQ